MMNSKNFKKVLSTSIASLTVLSTLSGSISTKIYAEGEIVKYAVEQKDSDNKVVALKFLCGFDDANICASIYCGGLDGLNDVKRTQLEKIIDKEYIGLALKGKASIDITKDDGSGFALKNEHVDKIIEAAGNLEEFDKLDDKGKKERTAEIVKAFKNALENAGGTDYKMMVECSKIKPAEKKDKEPDSTTSQTVESQQQPQQPALESEITVKEGDANTEEAGKNKGSGDDNEQTVESEEIKKDGSEGKNDGINPPADQQITDGTKEEKKEGTNGDINPSTNPQPTEQPVVEKEGGAKTEDDTNTPADQQTTNNEGNKTSTEQTKKVETKGLLGHIWDKIKKFLSHLPLIGRFFKD